MNEKLSFKSAAFFCVLIITVATCGSDGVRSVENRQDAVRAPKKCISCALQRGEISSIGGIVAATQHFLVQQDYEVPIPGFMIISSTRHIQSIDELTIAERSDFIELLAKVRCAMREVLQIKTVYLVQEEDSSHFHLWLFPRYSWMKNREKKIDSVKPIMRWAQEHLNTPENIRHVELVAHSLRDYMMGV
jgi:diadenosine tetraphosphate (Ap4A) HIT family hydrolase